MKQRTYIQKQEEIKDDLKIDGTEVKIRPMTKRQWIREIRRRIMTKRQKENVGIGRRRKD